MKYFFLFSFQHTYVHVVFILWAFLFSFLCCFVLIVVEESEWVVLWGREGIWCLGPNPGAYKMQGIMDEQHPSTAILFLKCERTESVTWDTLDPLGLLFSTLQV